MKNIRFIALIALMLGGMTMKAQDYHPIVEDGKQWNVLFSYPWSPPEPQSKYTDIYKIEGDTLLGGVEYKKLYTTRDEQLTNWQFCRALREEDRKVYMYEGGNERMLYDFSMQVGDTICVYDDGNGYQRCMVVSEIGETLVGDEPRQQIVLEYPFSETETWIEGIGSLYGILGSGSQFLVGGWTDLLCYYEDGDLIWQNSSSSTNSCYISGPQGGVVATPGFLTFDEPAVPQTLTISNHYDVAVTISDINVEPDDNMVLVSHTDLPQTIQPNESMNVEVVLNGIGNKGYNTYYINVVTSFGRLRVRVRVNQNAWSHFAPQGAEWYFNLSSFMTSPITYYRMAVEGDTVIQGHQCSVITRQYLGGNGDKQYVYEENNKVYWYNATLDAFTTLYDFDAEEGESWICHIDSCSYEVTVQSVEQVTWGGRTYRVQNITPIEGEFFYFYYGRIIEGIGSVEGLFPYPYACVGDMYDGPYPDYLRCYLVDGEMLYHEGDLECDAVLPWQYPCWDGTVAEAYDGGNGTAEDPYQIATPQQLALLAQQTNDGTGGDAYYLLTDDICLNASLEMWTFNWKPIGRVTDSTVAYFRGHFDGNGKTISKLLCETNEMMTDPVIGLFGCTDGAEIVNINLSDCRLTGGEYAGGLVGYAGSTDISNCSVQNSQITITGGVAGGIVGYAGVPFRIHETNENVSRITNCEIDLVTVESSVDAGGIVGKVNDDSYYARYLVSNCSANNEQYFHVKGSVSGGIVGEMRYGTIEGCASKTIVVGTGQVSNVCAGGIAGSIHGSSVIANSYNRGNVVADFEFAGGIVGYSAGNVYNVYNAGEIYMPDPNSSGYGTIIGNVQAGERLNCYWLENDLPAAGNPILPEMPGSTSFHRDSTATSWVLAEPQYGTVDLVEALNAGASEFESLYPEIGPVSRWKYSDAPIDFGLPVFEPNNSEGDELEAYCEAPMNFGGSPISDQGAYGAQLWWNKPFASHWFHYDEKPYAGSVYCNYWGIKIPAEEIQAGDVLTHVAFYKAGCQNQVAHYTFAFGVEGETEPDSWDYLPGNSVQVEPGPDEWVMVKLGNPIVCEEGKCLWIVLEAPNVVGYPAAYCQASGNPNACWSSEGSAAGDWMIRGYFINDVGYNDPGYNEDLDHYNIYRGSSLEELEKIAEVGRDEEAYFDTLQSPFGDYYYQLTASYTDGRESVPAKRGENPHDPDYVYFHVGNISSLGSEWYYEIQNENGSITYQHLEYVADTTVNHKDVKIIIRTNTLYDKGEHNVVTKEYIYEDFGKVYWWNETLQDFTLLYDLGAQIGDEWVIEVGTESITMHVDTVEQYEYEGTTYRMLHVSDANDLFSGEIMSGVGHLSSFFPERLMTRDKGYRVNGLRCYWIYGDLIFTMNRDDCAAIYINLHNGIEEDGPSTGSGTLTVYPNPTHNVLVVETRFIASYPSQTYRITNLMGQTLMSGKITAENQQIDVSNLPQGMYFISVGDVTRKFIVNK